MDIDQMRTVLSSQDRPRAVEDSTFTEDRRLVITKMKAMDLSTGLGQIPSILQQDNSNLQHVSACLGQMPAGFYVTILVGNNEYRTANKAVRADGGVVEWQDHIDLPSDLSSLAELRIYASLELGPMLGRGQLLQKFSISVRDLVDRSNVSRPICFLPEESEVVASCSYLEVTVESLSTQDMNAIVLCSPVSAESDEARALAEAADVGHTHMLRYYKDADESHLNRAITQFRRVLDRCPFDHPARSAALSILATAKFISSQARDAHLDLDVPIFLFKDALDLRSLDHPDHASSLLKLALALSSRFHKRDHAADADEAKELLDSVLGTCSPGGFEYQAAVFVSSIFALSTRAHGVGCADATVTVSSTQSASRGAPYSFDELYRELEQCKQRDDPRLLDDIISQHREALSFYVPGQLEWLDWKDSLGAALFLRFQRQGQKQDLEDALLFHREMLVWTPRHRTHHCRSLNNLADALRDHFWQDGDGKDVEEGVYRSRDALALTPPGHPDRARSLSNLGDDLGTQFQQSGDKDDLDEAIQLGRDVLALTPPGHPDRASYLSTLGLDLGTQFQQSGDRDDLDEAIQLGQDALALTPPGHPDRAEYLSTLGLCLGRQFQQSGDRDDLDKAIQLGRDALALTPSGHPDRASYLSSLGHDLGTQFQQSGDRDDLDEAIQLGQDALALTPPGHPDRASYLSTLGHDLGTRFSQSGDRGDFDHALQLCIDAVIAHPPNHPFQVHVFATCADTYLCLYQTQHNQEHLSNAMHYFHAATTVASGNMPERLARCISWIQHAEHYQHSSALDAYSRSLQLLDSHLAATASVSARHQARMGFPTHLPIDAASCALRCGNICQSVELLEQGRNLLWTQIA
ncbi:TPR-like protein [Paxillus ammoniavirescens]|nr:TPR-like protein [Paxillus ammoniavirescens]